MLRAIVLSGVGVLFGLGCGSASRCTPQSCFGCCDANGVCQKGSSDSSCGSRGAACSQCGSADVCVGGACITACGASNCAGCCDANQTCHAPGTGALSSGACGAAGAQCVACASPQVCNSLGVCAVPGSGGGCGASTCAGGCCDGTGTCIGPESQSAQICGTAGAACADCGTGTCNAGMCMGSVCNASTCASGCCQNGACVQFANQNATTCGAGGVTCAPCGGGQCDTTSGTCISTGGCSASNCGTGCCAGNTCVPYASQSSGQCGSGGAMCASCGALACDTTSGVCHTTTSCSQVAAGSTRNVLVLSSLNALPAPWVLTNGASLKDDLTGPNAVARIGDRVQINTTLHSTQSPCPLPFTSPKTGKTYCDGFTATDPSGNSMIFDSFAYFGTSNNCSGLLSDAGTGQVYSSLSGIWQDNYNSTTLVDLWVVAPTDCSDIGLSPDVNCGGGAGTGCAGTPPNSCDLNTLLMGTPSVDAGWTVRGVMTGKWTSTGGSWGGVIQDYPASGAGLDAVFLHHGADAGGFQGAAPNVGDFVKATGVLVNPGGKYWELEL